MDDIVIIWDDEDDPEGNYWHICVEGHGLTREAAKANAEREKAMSTKRTAKPKWTAADRARHKAIREEFAHCPTEEDLEASGECEGPIKSGAYFAVKVVIHELKKARQTAGLTLAAVSKLTGMDQATLSRLENGRQPNPTVDTLWRYARAVGRQLVLAHADAAPTERVQRKTAGSGRK